MMQEYDEPLSARKRLPRLNHNNAEIHSPSPRGATVLDTGSSDASASGNGPAALSEHVSGTYRRLIQGET